MALFSKNVDYNAPLPSTSRRKVAIGTWGGAGDPSVYGYVDFEAAPALAFIEEMRKETGLRITMSHVIAKSLAMVFARHPHANCILRLGKLYPRKTVDISFLVAAEGGADLSSLIIREADRKTIQEIFHEMDAHIEAIRKKGDPAFAKMKKTMKGIPGWLARPMITLTSYIMYGLNIWSPLFGTPKDGFGSVIVTNIGSLGLEMALPPLVPFSHAPFLITVGAVKDAPVVRNGQVIAAPVLRMCVTFDHRVIDGVFAGKMLEDLKLYFAEPKRLR